MRLPHPQLGCDIDLPDAVAIDLAWRTNNPKAAQVLDREVMRETMRDAYVRRTTPVYIERLPELYSTRPSSAPDILLGIAIGIALMILLWSFT